MMKRQLSSIHGHNITELERMLQDSCELFDRSVFLERESLGGWENINIRGNYDDFEFMLTT